MLRHRWCFPHHGRMTTTPPVRLRLGELHGRTGLRKCDAVVGDAQRRKLSPKRGRRDEATKSPRSRTGSEKERYIAGQTPGCSLTTIRVRERRAEACAARPAGTRSPSVRPDVCDRVAWVYLRFPPAIVSPGVRNPENLLECSGVHVNRDCSTATLACNHPVRGIFKIIRTLGYRTLAR